jgi:hypothetical protein
MKKATLVWLGSTVMALSLLATASWADDPEPEPELPPPADQTISLAGVGQVFAPSLDAPRTGSATLTINGVPYAVDISSQPIDLALLPNNFGQFVGTWVTVLDVRGYGSIMTQDIHFSTPTQDGWLNDLFTMNIIGGTGAFANITGMIDGSGVTHVDGDRVESLWLLEGAVSV